MNNEPKAYTMKEEGNTGVENEPKFETYSALQIAVYAANCSNSESDIEYVRHAIQSTIDQRESELRQSLSELIDALKELNSYAPDFSEYPNSLSKFDLGLQGASKRAESAIERAKSKLNGQQDKD